jgi:hypothetical protein
MIHEHDEWLHEVGSDPAWQESFYFNWADPGGKSFTLARIGYRFATRRTEALILSLRDGAPDFLYAPINLRHEGPCSDEDPRRGLRALGLCVTLEESLRRWRLQLQARDSMDVVFEASAPPFDYNADGRKMASNMTGHHFEQSGRVSGWTDFKGRRREIEAFGQRDKSWGVRDWGRLEGWNWISGQFGEDLSFNLTQTIEGGRTLDNGFVHRDGANHAVTQAHVTFRWGRQRHRPTEARLEIRDAGGATHVILARALASFPLVGRAWIEETHACFEWDTPTGRREGHGVMEHVWRAGPIALLERAPRVAHDLWRALRR